MQTIDWSSYLQKPYLCSCGRTHECDIEEIIIEEGAAKKLPEVLGRHNYRHLCVVCDKNTWEIAAHDICKNLKEEGYTYQLVKYEEEELIPDERAVFYLLANVPKVCDLIIGIGSGTINDLCRYVSFKMKLDYYIVGTAPSMDGYASNVSPLIINHLKTTYEAHPPKVIIGDLDIMTEAPMSMIAAGVGDILGKYVCLTDWKIAHIINGEYYCPEVAELVRKSIQKVVENAQKAAHRDKAAIAAIMEGLVLSGIAMSYIGNSRPASGSEHHMSHYWEMMFLLAEKPDPLHGTKVGIGTAVSIRLYEMLEALGEKLFSKQRPPFDYENWKKEIQEAYLTAAPGVLVLEEKIGKNADKEVLRRKTTLKDKYEEVKKVMEELPSSQSVIDLLKAMEAPFDPGQIGVSEETLKRGIFYAKDLRNRFGLLQILYDFNLQDELADQLIREIY
ncbi:MAG: sn-glycerol-1-phosphate dehydrogenase [Blautia sp.]